MIQITRKMFFRLLKEKGLYNNFFDCLKACVKNNDTRRFLNYAYNGDINKFLKEHFDCYNVTGIIIDGFTWSETPGGDDCWNNFYKELVYIQYGYKKIEEYYHQPPT